MLKTILIVAALILLAAEAVVLLQFIRCLKLHKEESPETHSEYLIRRLNTTQIIGFVEAMILLALIFLK